MNNMNNIKKLPQMNVCESLIYYSLTYTKLIVKRNIFNKFAASVDVHF